MQLLGSHCHGADNAVIWTCRYALVLFIPYNLVLVAKLIRSNLQSGTNISSSSSDKMLEKKSP